MEIWKDIAGFEGYYQVSNHGNVKSFAWGKERILKPGRNSGGYLCVVLHAEGMRSTRTVHRLVMEAFVPNEEGKESINHKNGVKADNHLSNLEWATLSENMQHAYDTGLKVITDRQRQSPRLRPWKGRDTSRVVFDENSGVYYNSIKEASEAYGMNYNTLLSQINGQNKNRTSLRYA